MSALTEVVKVNSKLRILDLEGNEFTKTILMIICESRFFVAKKNWSTVEDKGFPQLQWSEQEQLKALFRKLWFAQIRSVFSFMHHC